MYHPERTLNPKSGLGMYNGEEDPVLLGGTVYLVLGWGGDCASRAWVDAINLPFPSHFVESIVLLVALA